ncbi:hypothetical protein CHS0354_024069 [Potamilus streckersoni]|uniref:YbbR-like domain-containing protein n=1 Tax=Potamilus streckersoni TaxID=2493646 RepID=A0AAE0S055_9BIVA|nr:hypothetical protein CHS0354_024069 [Potamilus streckersoni]
MSLSNVLTVTLPVAVKSNSNYSPLSVSPNHISVTVTGSGWELVKFYISEAKITIKLEDERSKFPSENTLFFAQNLSHYLEFPKYIEVTPVKFSPSSIQYSLRPRFSKIVPIRLRALPTVESGFTFTSIPRFEPDSVTIVGAVDLVQPISHWDIDVSDRKLKSGEFFFPVSLTKNTSSLIEIFPQTSNIYGHIETLTEIAFNQVSVQVYSLEDRTKVQLIPDKLSVALIGPASKLASLTQDSIRAFVEYKDLISDTTGSIIPKIEHPPYVSVKMLQPKTLKYIIQN